MSRYSLHHSWQYNFFRSYSSSAMVQRCVRAVTRYLLVTLMFVFAASTGTPQADQRDQLGMIGMVQPLSFDLSQRGSNTSNQQPWRGLGTVP